MKYILFGIMLILMLTSAFALGNTSSTKYATASAIMQMDNNNVQQPAQPDNKWVIIGLASLAVILYLKTKGG